MTATLVYIHGANATKTSWNYLRSKVKSDQEHIIEYSCHGKFADNLNQMLDELSQFKKIIFISHSLGGIYAYHLASHLPFKTVGGISIATPFGGVHSAYLLSLLFPFYQLYKEIKPNSLAVTGIQTIHNVRNWTQIIASRGHNPMINGKNDGVVTIASQRQINCEKINMSESHNEILQSEHLAGLIINKFGINLT